MTKIRRSVDIRYVIIYHTGHVSDVTPEVVNNSYVQEGGYGAPYDIVIDSYGGISLTPYWTRSPKRGKIETGISPTKIFKYTEHFLIPSTPILYQSEGLHIGIIGDYDTKRPNSIILSTLIKILEETIYWIGIDLYVGLLYYSELSNKTSPGVFFFDKYYLLNSIDKNKKPRLKIIREYEDPTDDTMYKLTEDDEIKVTEGEEFKILE